MDKLIQPSLEADPSLSALATILERFNSLDLSPLIIYWPEVVHKEALPHLAWHFSVLDEHLWSLAGSDEDMKRKLIASAIEIQRYKGTPWSIKELLRLLGYGDSQIIEGDSSWVLDGTRTLDGTSDLNSESDWATYTVVMGAPIANQDADRLRKSVSKVAPARCKLKKLDYTATVFKLDGSVTLDGTYNLGTNEI